MHLHTSHAEILSSLFWVVLAGTLPAQKAPAAPPPTILLRHATLLDGVGPDARRDVAITLRRGRIESIRPDRGGQAPDDVAADTVIDLLGAWVMPGLIDAHAHLGVSRAWGEDDSVAAQRALDRGVTTLRSLGSPAGFGDVGLKRAFLAGEARLPRVLASGAFIIPIVGEDWLRDTPGFRSLLDSATAQDSAKRLSTGPGWRLAGNAAAIDSAVGLLAARGVDWVKVFANGRAGIASSDPRATFLDENDMRVAVSAARRRGLRVAAHAYTDEAVRAAVLAGVNSVEHGAYVSEETLRLMKARGTCLVPTLTAFDEPSPDPVVRARAVEIRRAAELAVGRARALGVPVIAGTDYAYPPGARTLSAELVALQRAGLPPDEVIRAATSRAATCLGIGDRTGRVVTRLEADLIVVDRDPRIDLKVLDRPKLVILGGRLVRRVPLAAVVESTLVAGGIEAARDRIRQLYQSPVDSIRYGEYELIGLGVQLGMGGRVPEALAMFQANVEVYPDSPNAWDALGQAFLMLGRKDDALQAWTRTVMLAERQGHPRLAEFRAKLDRLRR
jgi:imidazolonepropionase-like amidohydrolase